MALPVNHQSDLIVLQAFLERHPQRTSADTSVENAGPVIKFTLRLRGDAVELEVPAADFGLPSSFSEPTMMLQRPQVYSAPERFIAELKSHLDGQLGPNEPLWFELANPAGTLPLLPWERLLQPSLGAPILRLPYFSLEPDPYDGPLDVVLCATAPPLRMAGVPRRAAGVAAWLDTTSASIGAAVRPGSTVHVFANVAVHDLLKERLPHLQASAGNSEVRLYDPRRITRGIRSVQRKTDVRHELSPWLRWICDTLAKQRVAADVVHFVCHGFVIQDQGALMLAKSPWEISTSEDALFIRAQELLTFLTLSGAWSVGFSAPPMSLTNPGLRLLADQIARARPGPVISHDLRRDPKGAQLTTAYRFLLAEPSQTSPPNSPNLGLYCHPGRARRTQGAMRSITLSQVLTNNTIAVDELVGAGSGRSAGETPTWLAACQRFLEQQVAALFSDPVVAGTSSPAELGKKQALQLMSGILEEFAGQTRQGGGHG